MHESSAAPRLPPRALWLVVTRGLSGMGSALTSFALNVWIFERTQSYAVFAILAIVTMLPNLVLAPFAGMLVDRWKKHHLLLGCELAPMAALVAALCAMQAGVLTPLAVGALNLVMAVTATMRWMVMGVVVSTLVEAPDRARINGLQQSFAGAATVLGPTLGAAAIQVVGPAGLLSTDLALSVVAAITLLGIRIPEPDQSRASRDAARMTFWQEVTFGWRWIAARPGLFRLMLFFTILNLGVAVYGVAFTPYLLANGAGPLLAWGLSTQGAGAFLGGLALARWRGRFDAEAGVVFGALAFGVVMTLWGMSRQTAVLIALAGAAGVLTSLVMSSSQTLWQREVPPDIQGKVFAARLMTSYLLRPVAVLASMPFATYVGEPLLVQASWARWFWGDGATASLGAVLSLLGLGITMGCVVLAVRGGFGVATPTGDLPQGAVTKG
ncbi:MFS transporter [Roseateles sp.]|uniref:MFS transporter n=1 Tax=Roseateles sp. TaxID=1971397 RepID=UPI003D10E505